MAEIWHGLDLPEFGDGHGMEFELSIQWQDGIPIIEHDAALKIGSGLGGQPSEAIGIGGFDARRRFHFDAPSAIALCEHAIDLDLIFVPIVPEPGIRFQPVGLDHQLLEHKGLQEMSKTLAVFRPGACGDSCERRSQSASR